MQTVRFKELGRMKKTFERIIPELNHQEMEKAMRTCPGHGIMSRDVGFSVSENGKHGWVLVGGFREVGQWEILD